MCVIEFVEAMIDSILLLRCFRERPHVQVASYDKEEHRKIILYRYPVIQRGISIIMSNISYVLITMIT